MDSREVCLLIGPGNSILWSDASQSPIALPDSRTRWEAIWERREQLVEIAHSHPVGPLAFSHEDETTMEALLAALGKPIRFSVVAPNGMIARVDGKDALVALADEPWWTALLRLASGMRSLQPAKNSTATTP
jgi:hypothetical protein